jgi:hypothetical protein
MPFDRTLRDNHLVAYAIPITTNMVLPAKTIRPRIAPVGDESLYQSSWPLYSD